MMGTTLYFSTNNFIFYLQGSTELASNSMISTSPTRRTRSTSRQQWRKREKLKLASFRMAPSK